GNGSFTPVAWDIPITGASVTNDLSGPSAFDGNIEPEIPRLREQHIITPGQAYELVGTNLAENPRFSSLDYQWGDNAMWYTPSLTMELDGRGVKATGAGSGYSTVLFLDDDSTDSS